MEEELQKEINADVELIPGSGGIYEITVDGRMIFSKFKSKRFPDPGEIVSLIKKL